ncbi:MAG: DUF5796 family protein [Haloarculaceae archaeon]
MHSRSDVSPDTLPIELTEDGIEVEYLDGRAVFYRGVPTPVEGSVKTAPGKDTHVLVTDKSETQGVLVYVNERNTEDAILEDTGVGRVVLDDGEETTVFPGVAVSESAMRIEIDADTEAVDGRIFVFEEDELGERSFELVPPGSTDDSGAEGDGGEDGEDDVDSQA